MGSVSINTDLAGKLVRSTRKPTWYYVGRCAGCGAAVAVCAALAENLPWTAASVASMIRDGLRVEGHPWGDDMVGLEYCRCPKQEGLGI